MITTYRRHWILAIQTFLIWLMGFLFWYFVVSIISTGVGFIAVLVLIAWSLICTYSLAEDYSKYLTISDNGVTRHWGVFPWQRGEFFLSWSQIYQCTYNDRTFLRWLLGYGSIFVYNTAGTTAVYEMTKMYAPSSISAHVSDMKEET